MEEKAMSMYLNGVIVKDIKITENIYEITAESMGNKDTLYLDVKYASPEISKMAQDIENGKKIDENVEIEISDFEFYDNSSPCKGWGRCVYIHEERGDDDDW